MLATHANVFSKELGNHIHALSLYLVFHTSCRIHETLRMAPAMAAGGRDCTD